MDFNDLTQKFTEKVKKIGKDTAEEVQKLNKIRQLNGKVSDAKKQIENIYSEIGKKFYELHKDYIPEGFEELIQTINERQNEIEQLKEQLREVKGVVLCPGCNMEVSGDERFCPNCGSKMPEPVEVADAEDEASVVVDAEEVVSEAAEGAKDAAEEVKEAAEDAAEGAKEVVADAAGEVKDAAANAAEEVKETAEDVAEGAKDAAADAADSLRDTAEDLAGKAKEKAGEIAEGAKEVAEKAAEELMDAAENLKEDIKKMF